jgi:hypothetical protein
MPLSERSKINLGVVWGFAFVIFLIIYLSNNTFSCDKYTTNFKNREAFHLVLTAKSTYQSTAYFDGTDLQTKKPVRYIERSGYIEDMIDTFKVGDTLIKNKSEYAILIKRKGGNKVIQCECNGKVYH